MTEFDTELEKVKAVASFNRLKLILKKLDKATEADRENRELKRFTEEFTSLAMDTVAHSKLILNKRK